MKQKLIAVAVAGALAAPAAALAQSTIQMYGTIKMEYGFVSGPDSTTPGVSYEDYDGLNSGSSNLGFKGEEKLGGGMSAWFQCESDLRFLSGANNARASGSLCDRNSAIGLKAGFGNVFVGTWDSPEKIAIGRTRILEDTGWTGVTHMLFNESNRNSNSINYHSPAFSGFQVYLQTTTTNAQQNTLSNAVNKKDGRSNGLAVTYKAGPLDAVFGYTVQDENAAAASITGSEDKSMTIGAAYTWKALRAGITYNKAEAETRVGLLTADGKRDAWNFGGTYDFGGPHYMWAGYTMAKDVKGQVAGVALPGDTGGDQWQIGYGHKLSKRTEARLGYTRVSNDGNSDLYTVGNIVASNMRAGSDSSVFALQVFHRF